MSTVFFIDSTGQSISTQVDGTTPAIGLVIQREGGTNPWYWLSPGTFALAGAATLVSAKNQETLADGILTVPFALYASSTPVGEMRVRSTSLSDGYILRLTNTGIQPFVEVGGVETSLQALTVVSWAGNAQHTIEWTFNGSNHTIKVDGSTVTTFTDSTILTAGYTTLTCIDAGSSLGVLNVWRWYSWQLDSIVAPAGGLLYNQIVRVGKKLKGLPKKVGGIFTIQRAPLIPPTPTPSGTRSPDDLYFYRNRRRYR